MTAIANGIIEWGSENVDSGDAEWDDAFCSGAQCALDYLGINIKNEKGLADIETKRESGEEESE